MQFPAWILAISALLPASQPTAAQTPAPTFASLSQQAPADEVRGMAR